MHTLNLRWFRFVMIPVLATILYFSLALLSPPEELSSYLAVATWWYIFVEIVLTIFFATLYSETNIILSNYLDQKIQWERSPFLRVGIQFGIAFFIGSALGYLSFLVIYWIIPIDYPSPPAYQIFIAGFLIALPITLVYLILHLFSRWKKTLLEAEILKRENLSARFEALKNQLDPHFLFNNLNTLTAIVEEDPQQAVDFIQKLSYVYRYVLLNKDKNTVTLAEELKLAEAYIFLLKSRFGAFLTVEIDIPKALSDREVPPMTLQLLLENVVKHNVIDHRYPLSIWIFQDEKTGNLVVKNTLRKKPNPEESTRIGLQNINDRLRLMGQNGLSVQEEHSYFSISLPLKTSTV